MYSVFPLNRLYRISVLALLISANEFYVQWTTVELVIAGDGTEGKFDRTSEKY